MVGTGPIQSDLNRLVPWLYSLMALNFKRIFKVVITIRKRIARNTEKQRRIELERFYRMQSFRISNDTFTKSSEYLEILENKIQVLESRL